VKGVWSDWFEIDVALFDKTVIRSLAFNR